jgi:hypothetical protein
MSLLRRMTFRPLLAGVRTTISVTTTEAYFTPVVNFSTKTIKIGYVCEYTVIRWSLLKILDKVLHIRPT